MPNKIGVIFCCYGNPDYVNPCLKPWLELKEKFNIKIAAVNGQFKEYSELGIEDSDTETQNKIKELYNNKSLDFLYIQNDIFIEKNNRIYQTEAKIRDRALQWLLKENVDFVILLDSDEIYAKKEIENLIEYINREDNKFYTVFQIEFKNLTFSDKTYTKGFNPKRVWRVDIGEFILSKVTYDNDMEYVYKATGLPLSDDLMVWKSIPINILNPLHHSWNDYERSYEKIKYQQLRWNPPKGNGCSFKINKEKKCIEFDLEYFKRIGQQPPEIFEI